MQLTEANSFSISNSKQVLSSKSRIYKTELFIKQTKGLIEIDEFIKRLANGIIKNVIVPLNLYSNHKTNVDECFIVSTIDGSHSFLFKLGYQLHSSFTINSGDIVFYKYLGKEKKGKHEDRRFVNYIKSKDQIDVIVKLIKSNTQDSEFLKLYILSNTDQVNFPLLNNEQEKIVMLEDQNVVVQGVAGSGKTNVCIDKIIYAACRRYKGNVLYSTYSHGLLEDTKTKIELFTYNIKTFLSNYKEGKIEFVDEDHKKAIENELGIWLDIISDSQIEEKLKSIIDYLENKVDYFMLEDLYKLYGETYAGFANENYFVKEYLGNIKNYNLAGNLDKIKNVSNEIVYKEIYGIIFGCVDENNPQKIVTKDDYINLRQDCFSKQECEIIYAIAMDYLKYQTKEKLIDNNVISRYLLANVDNILKYSLVVLDEVQDFTQINLCLFKKITFKMFCVGDVLQMINPTYFSFAYLKRLMFEKNIVSVIELKNNYRNSVKIERLIDNLSDLNVEQFGTHNFVIRGKSVESDVPTSTIYVNDGNFINQLAQNVFEDLTIVVGSLKKKEAIRKIAPKQEVLTISEIKGLERNSIVLLDILSDNYEKWDQMQRNIISKKKAEENSIYRYYFNLLYVGISRAKQNLFVVERKTVGLFKNFFDLNFEVQTQKEALENVNKIVGKIEIDEDEIQEKINQFIKLEQYDNARWLTAKFPDEEEGKMQSSRIDVFEQYVRTGDYRGAGIKFWQLGLFEDAKTQFKKSGDTKLIELVEACIENNGKKLEYDIVQFFPDVCENKEASKLIIETLKDDLFMLNNNQKQINKEIKTMKEKKHGNN